MANATVASVLAGHSPYVRALSKRLLTLIRAAGPERDGDRLRGVALHHVPGRSPRLLLRHLPEGGHVQVGFEFGVLRPDPESLLAGAGSQLRYVTGPSPGRGGA